MTVFASVRGRTGHPEGWGEKTKLSDRRWCEYRPANLSLEEHRAGETKLASTGRRSVMRLIELRFGGVESARDDGRQT